MLENYPMERFQKLKSTPPSSADFGTPGTGIILYVWQGYNKQIYPAYFIEQ